MARTNTILAAENNFNAYRNDTFETVVFFFEDEALSVPFDLSQWDTLVMQIRMYANARTILVSLELGAGLTIIGTNQLEILIEPEEMDISTQLVVYDIEGQNVDETKTILRGNILIDKDITRL